MSRPREHDRVSPVLIGPRNCEAACGVPWRRVRECAVRHGVKPVKIGVAFAFHASELLGALRADEAQEAISATAPADPAAALREQLGLKLVGGR